MNWHRGYRNSKCFETQVNTWCEEKTLFEFGASIEFNKLYFNALTPVNLDIVGPECSPRIGSSEASETDNKYIANKLKWVSI